MGIGGKGPNRPPYGVVNDTYNYDIGTEKWTQGSELPCDSCYSYSSMVTASPGSNYVAYLVGGTNGGQSSKEVYGLSKQLDRWDILGHFTTPRYGHVALKIPKDFVNS